MDPVQARDQIPAAPSGDFLDQSVRLIFNICVGAAVRQPEIHIKSHQLQLEEVQFALLPPPHGRHDRKTVDLDRNDRLVKRPSDSDAAEVTAGVQCRAADRDPDSEKKLGLPCPGFSENRDMALVGFPDRGCFGIIIPVCFRARILFCTAVCFYTVIRFCTAGRFGAAVRFCAHVSCCAHVPFCSVDRFGAAGSGILTALKLSRDIKRSRRKKPSLCLDREPYLSCSDLPDLQGNIDQILLRRLLFSRSHSHAAAAHSLPVSLQGTLRPAASQAAVYSSALSFRLQKETGLHRFKDCLFLSAR